MKLPRTTALLCLVLTSLLFAGAAQADTNQAAAPEAASAASGPTPYPKDANDLSAQQDIQQTRSNIVEMIDMAERASPGVPIVVCTLPPRNHPQAPVDPKRLIELNKLIVSLDRTNAHVAVLDLYPLLVDAD